MADIVFVERNDWADWPSATSAFRAADANRYEDAIAALVTAWNASIKVEVITQAAYDALGTGRPATTAYLIVD